MKITIDSNQIKSGEHLMFVGKKRQADMENRVNRHEPILLSSPVFSDGKTYAIIVPLSLTPTDTSKWRLRFRPVSVKCFRACHIRSTKIQALVCDFGGKQIMFDENGARPSTFTLNGNGVDPEAVGDPETALAWALDGQPSNPAVMEASKYLAATFGSVPA